MPILRLLAIAILLVLGSGLGVYQLQHHSRSELSAPEVAKADASFNNIVSQLETFAQTERLDFQVPPHLQGKVLYDGKVNEKAIALTFDDGPWPETTLQMLAILQQNHVKATFFWVGTALQEQPEIAQKVVAAGHAIGNHTWHHWYRSMDADTAAKEIEDTAALTYRITGVKTQLFRPPGGFLNNGVAAYAKKQNYAVIMWSVSSADTDWKAAPEAFTNNVLKGVKPGAIVLMHDGGGNHQKTVQALPAIIMGLKQQGYRFVTVPELLKMSELSGG